ncbi:MAG: hypothetical protein LBS39_04585 [Campylobacteraceae bacterium]|nr:hypothetical protein [Campylobacteraceae bacterium]
MSLVCFLQKLFAHTKITKGGNFHHELGAQSTAGNLRHSHESRYPKNIQNSERFYALYLI